MRVYNGSDKNEEATYAEHESFTDLLWRCDDGNVNDYKQIHNITLTRKQWIYRGEGNANLVISLPKEKVIVRLQKLEYDVIISSSLLEEREKQLMRDVEFYRKVMISFLGTAFFHPPILARINEHEVFEIDKKLFTIRPKFRLSKGIRLGLVSIHPDYTHLPPVVNTLPPTIIYNESHLIMETSPTYCIEIKPKQGWIPLLDRKHPKCTFCMNQYLKVMKKRVLGISQYCPLDLFSGNILRMKRAIRNLLLNPQNNLKIFKNGNLVLSDDCELSYLEVLIDFFQLGGNNDINIDRLVDRWCSLVVACLCTRLTNTQSSKNSYFSNDIVTTQLLPYQISKSTFSPLNGHIKSCDWSSQNLPTNSILQRILKVQQLQNSKFSTVCSHYKERCTTEKDYSYLDSLLDSDGNIDVIQRYLLATTAKDCSIFIALQSTVKLDLPYKMYYIKDCEGREYRLNIGISDIDPKPLSCIGKHIKRDQEILFAVMHFINHSGD
ncbi:hypothetical protein O3M35_004052 [Rhynocoris fuscipes]|uniref:Inositol-pentakisphosphate 2-kinase n=1 Tax=Rhynocoris fuscipes TaxID=488301 RepID=A0AAW1CKZ9_9HEMI